MNAALAVIVAFVALAIGLGLRARRGHDIGFASRLSSITTRMPLRSEWSWTSEISVSFFSLTSSACCARWCRGRCC